MPSVKELHESRLKSIHDARSILDRCDAEKRLPSSDEEKRYGDFLAEADKHKSSIEMEERRVKLAADSSEIEEEVRRLSQSAGRTGLPSTGEQRMGGDGAKLMEGREAAELQACRSYLRTGRPGKGLKASEERDLIAGDDASAGAIILPLQLQNVLRQKIDNTLWIRASADVQTVDGAESLGCPTLEEDPSDAEWTTELRTGSDDTAMTFGRRDLNPKPLAKRIKISRDLVRKTNMSVESLVLGRIAYKIAVTEEKAFLTGTGSNQPLGVFTDSDMGIPTSRNYSTGNTASALTFDGILGAYYQLREGYRAKGQWIFHRDVLAQVAKVKDGNGNYIWRPAVEVGRPDTILGRPVRESEYAPSSMVASAKVGIFGDFSQYIIADSTAQSLLVLVELYAESNMIGYILRRFTDGMPVFGEAFCRLALAAS